MICVPILINVVILTVVTFLILNTHNTIALTVCFLILGIFFVIFVKTIFELCQSPFEDRPESIPKRRNDERDVEEDNREEIQEMAAAAPVAENPGAKIEQDKALDDEQSDDIVV